MEKENELAWLANRGREGVRFWEFACGFSEKWLR